MRVLLNGMQTQAQVDVFHYLADTLEKQTGIKPVIGIDTTGQGGQAVASFLEDVGHPIVWANLAKNVEFGTRMESDEEYMDRMKKNPMDNPARLTVMMEAPLKQIAIPALKKVLYTGELRLVNQEELIKQFMNTTDTEQTNNQNRKYSTDYNGPDGNKPDYNHDLQSFEVLGAMLHHDAIAPEIQAYRDMWIEDFDMGWGQYERNPAFLNG